MTDVFYVKQGSTSPSIVTTLLDSTGAAVDVSGADSITFRMDGPDLITGAAALDDGPNGVVRYDWAVGDLDTWGGYAVEWVVDDNGNIDIYPGPGYDWVEVVPNLTTDIGGICRLSDVRRELGRAMTDPEYTRAANMILQLTALLERKLHRRFQTATVTETQRIDRLGRLVPYQGPVLAVTAISVDGVAWTGDLTEWDLQTWPQNSLVEITYTVGSDIDAGVAGAIASIVARTVLTPAAVATGAVTGYSVEGTSITYGNVSGADNSGGNVGRFTVGDLGSFAGLYRPVLRT